MPVYPHPASHPPPGAPERLTVPSADCHQPSIVTSSLRGGPGADAAKPGWADGPIHGPLLHTHTKNICESAPRSRLTWNNSETDMASPHSFSELLACIELIEGVYAHTQQKIQARVQCDFKASWYIYFAIPLWLNNVRFKSRPHSSQSTYLEGKMNMQVQNKM